MQKHDIVTAAKCAKGYHFMQTYLPKCSKGEVFEGYTPFAVHYEKIRNHLRETATNSAKIHSLVRKYEHLRINQIQLRFLHFNQHSKTLLGIHMRHWAYKRENILSLTPTSKSLTLF